MTLSETRRLRRVAASVLALAGMLDVISAITPPAAGRLRLVAAVVPLAVPRTAAVLVAAAGVALLVLARGVRRGLSHAWFLAVGLLAGSTVLHLVKGVDVEEAVVAFGATVYLLRARAAFRVPARNAAVRASAALLVGAATFACGLAALIASAGDERFATALHAVAGRSDVMGLLLVASVGTCLFRVPVTGSWDVEADRALAIVRRHGRDSLAYFALRDDKAWFVWGDTLVAYAVRNGVCLVSPDPIGPPDEALLAWAAFRRAASERGWAVAVLGASAEWVERYAATGMRSVYIGDEAEVDVASFRLTGGDRKSLRQAVNRVARYGYEVSFHRPSTIPPAVRLGLASLAEAGRRGEVERGFSMTLGRLFDPADDDILVAVATGPDGVPAAFCQWVPADGGWSLDVMRRARSGHPNGLLDFVVVRTIEHVRETGGRRVTLNFATRRAVLAGETGDGLTPRLERWLLNRLSDSLQIESLWRFNAKFGPAWRPRYALFEAPEHLLGTVVAVARAEAVSELPLVGRFLAPRGGGA